MLFWRLAKTRLVDVSFTPVWVPEDLPACMVSKPLRAKLTTSEKDDVPWTVKSAEELKSRGETLVALLAGVRCAAFSRGGTAAPAGEALATAPTAAAATPTPIAAPVRTVLRE